MKHDHTSTGRVLHDQICRRAFLGRSALGLGAFGMASLLGRLTLAQDGGSAIPAPTATPRAKRVILVFFNGGASQLDLFDSKPILTERRGEELPPSLFAGKQISGDATRAGALAAVGPAWKFKKYGESGLELSELLPHLGAVADDLCVVNTFRTDHVVHEEAIATLLTGTNLLGRPSWGSWVSYALGTLNENLPEFVVLLSNPQGDTPLQPRLWHNGFLPAPHQGVRFRSGKDPVLFVERPPGVTEESQAQILDAIRRLNEREAEATGDPGVSARIGSYEMAARMQTSIPELTDLKSEPAEVLERYGADPERSSFANNCLLARRMCERDVRFIQLCDGGWDNHDNIPRSIPRKAKQIDQPLGALIGDLKERGLLDETLIVCAGEFGRTPFCDGSLSFDRYGRDHHSLAGPALLAGGGVRGGLSYGKTDEWGYDTVENPVHVHDLQATTLHCLGYDHEKLVFRHEGRDFRLTDVGGHIVHDILT